jgi:hypothetical protein
MVKRAEVKLNSKGHQDVLKSAGVRAAVAKSTNAIRDAAGPGMVASVKTGRTRVRGTIVTRSFFAKRAESKQKRLTRAIDAGRW